MIKLWILLAGALLIFLVACRNEGTPTPEQPIPECPAKAYRSFYSDFSMRNWIEKHPEIRSLDIQQLGKNGNKGFVLGYCR